MLGFVISFSRQIRYLWKANSKFPYGNHIMSVDMRNELKEMYKNTNSVMSC